MFVEFSKKEVFTRWSNHRARKFSEQFVDEVRKQLDERTQSADLDEMLAQIAKGEAESALLYESYRRVALCASRDIGPMVIGLLTAIISLRERPEATQEDEQIFMAAEALNDRDFEDFVRWFPGAAAQNKKSQPPLPTISAISAATAAIRVRSSLTQNVFSENDTPINLFTDVGPFAPKLASLGLMMQLDHSNQAGKVEHFVTASTAALRLHVLADRAKTARDGTSSS